MGVNCSSFIFQAPSIETPRRAPRILAWLHRSLGFAFPLFFLAEIVPSGNDNQVVIISPDVEYPQWGNNVKGLGN